MSGPSKSAAVAERPAPARVTPVRIPALMRKCACGISSAPCSCEEEKKKKKIQRKASSSAPLQASTPPAVDRVLDRPGQPLDTGTRGFMESRFGHDFAQVRVHTGADAAESARAVGAHAYTVGNDIVFDSGRYDPHSESGRRLLAHELTHTVQQRGIQRSANPALSTTAPGDACESEADAIATSVLAGAPAGPLISHAAHAPVIARTSVTGNEKPEPATNPKAAELAAIGWEEHDLPDADKSQVRRFDCKKPFPVPASKGADAVALWDAKAKGGSLESVIDTRGTGKPSVAKSQERPSAEDLRKLWLKKVRWSEADAGANWKRAGGDTESFAPPRAGDHTCDMDHIVELQVGGNNVPENIQPLDFSPNRSAGSTIKNYLSGKATDIRRIYGQIPNVILHYESAAPDSGELGEGKPTAKCYEIEQRVTTGKVEGLAITKPAGVPYPIAAGGSKATIYIVDKEEPVQLHKSKIVENDAAATIIPGMLLNQLTRKKNQISAGFDTRKGSKLPVDIDPTQHLAIRVDKNHELKIDPKQKRNIGFTFPYLSKGRITRLELVDGSISGEGWLEPNIALLRGVRLEIRFSKDELVVTTSIPKDKLKSLPGFRVTEAGINLQLYPTFSPSGKIAFVVGSEKKPILDGSVELSAPGGDFTAAGKLNANLPGFDTATGDVTYKRSAGWTGTLSLSTSKVPGAKNVSVQVMLSDRGYTVSGGLTIGLPTGDDLKLAVKQVPGKKPVYTGDVTLTVKRLDPVKLSFIYDGDNLTATGKTGFKLLGATGTVAVKYHNGTITGTGRLKFAKGRASGFIDVELLKNHRFKGEGQLSYQVTENLRATAGAKLDENEKLTLAGALEFIKPIQLFKPSSATYKFFTIAIKIPIPGASIGPVGIQARIEASLSAGYQIGPGELRKVRIEATFNPLEENIDPKLKMTGQLYIAASATVSGELSGSIALDVLVAEVAGGISVIPSATLKGEFTADALVQYEKKEYSLQADFAVNLALTLALALTAWVKAKAGISVFSVETRKDWTLAKYTYDPGLKLGVKAPIRYASNQPFRLPTADEIVWTKPTIDVKSMLKSIFAGARSEERKV